jgi:hypothetical protein
LILLLGGAAVHRCDKRPSGPVQPLGERCVAPPSFSANYEAALAANDYSDVEQPAIFIATFNGTP